MEKSTKLLLIFFLFCFFSVQFYLTIFGGFLWPFSSHRLFSQMPKKEKWIVQAVLEDSENNRFTIHPGRVIPIEFCRCSGLIRHLHEKGKKEQKHLFTDYALRRVNEDPWWAFDEMFSAVTIEGGLSFQSLRFEEHHIELDNPVKVLEKKVLF